MEQGGPTGRQRQRLGSTREVRAASKGAAFFVCDERQNGCGLPRPIGPGRPLERRGSSACTTGAHAEQLVRWAKAHDPREQRYETDEPPRRLGSHEGERQ